MEKQPHYIGHRKRLRNRFMQQGLEALYDYEVVAVGSLDKQFRVGKQVDRDLAPFFHRPPFEPEKRITEFERMRHYYVAFSRAEKILALTTTDTPKDFFEPIWEGLDQWPYVEKEVLESLNFKPNS